MSKEKFKSWATGFSATVLKLITFLWACFMGYSAVMITIAVYETGSLVEVGTFITEVNKTFIASVVTILIARVVENVFEHNDGGIFGHSIKEETNDSTDSGVPADDMCNDDGSGDGSDQEDICG